MRLHKIDTERSVAGSECLHDIDREAYRCAKIDALSNLLALARNLQSLLSAAGMGFRVLMALYQRAPLVWSGLVVVIMVPMCAYLNFFGSLHVIAQRCMLTQSIGGD